MVENRPYTPEEARQISREMGEVVWEQANKIANQFFGDDYERDAAYVDALYERAKTCGCKSCLQFADRENQRKLLEWKRPVEDDDNVEFKIKKYAPKPRRRRRG